MPTLSDIFNLDPDVERLTLLPRLRGSLPSEKSVMMPDRYMFDVIAPKFLYDFIRAVKSPGRAARGEVLDEEEALNTAMNMFGGGLATSGSVPLGALGMSARTAPAGTVPLREVPRSPLGFYSKVEEATLPLQNKGAGSQFLAQIQKTPGVKPEEIEVLGLDKFLQSKPTVTKQEVQDYITANKPDVQEVRLGEMSAEQTAAIDQAKNRYREITDLVADTRLKAEQGMLSTEEAMEILRPLMAERGRLDNQIVFNTPPATKFSKYTIPGGENYREILMTLPQKVEKGFTTPNGAFFSEADLADPVVRSTAEKIGLSPAFRNVGDSYKSSHYSQPNILTHLRANDRVIDGKKALFIEEIQSDWHQAGRKKGYATQPTRSVADIENEASQVNRERSRLLDEAAALPDSRMAEFNAMNDRIKELTVRARQLGDEFDAAMKPKDVVPDAPFKKSWHELALKRAIQEAVDKGYDKLAFTTGKTQAERYDLSKQVDELLYKKNPDGTYRLSAQVRGRGESFGDAIPESKLEDYVGKEVAKSITQGSGKDVNLGGPGSFTQPRDDWKSMSGLDLQVGGEGMKGFYDNILPKSLDKLGKKFDAKVGKTEMDGVEVWAMDITPQMREQVGKKGQPLFASTPPLGLASQDPLEQFVGAEQPKFTEQDLDPLMKYLGYK